jgi:hypothetical protein
MIPDGSRGVTSIGWPVTCASLVADTADSSVITDADSKLFSYNGCAMRGRQQLPIGLRGIGAAT